MSALPADEIGALFAAARAAGRHALTEPEAKRVLALAGLAVPRGVSIDAAEPVPPSLAGLTPPFALKLIAPGILHKSDVGGVTLGLADATAVEDARRAMCEALADRPIDGFLVEEMAAPGHEIVMGALVDRRFGPVVMLGLGGIFIEVLGDVAFRLAPLRRGDGEAMLAELRAKALLDGARGGPVASRAAIEAALVRFAGPDGLLPAFAAEIEEIDINPLIVSAAGAVAVDARIVLREHAAPRQPAQHLPDQEPPALDRFAPLFAPRAIAVIGASASGNTQANGVIRHLRDYGFPGPIYPVHPSAATVEGLPAYPSLSDLPEPVDYAFVGIAAAQVPATLRAAKGRVRFAQVMSSGFGEAEDGRAREADLVAAARESGMRVIGPNCLGTFSPRGRLTFIAGMAPTLGSVGVLSQSGGLGMDVLRRGQRRGLAFSGLVTIGNCADVKAGELLEFFIEDPQTRVIGLYLEDAADGRRLYELMARTDKPIVLLKGGRTRQGRRAALSHTGALASDDRLWVALARQTGAALVETLDSFINALLAFQTLAPRDFRPTERVAVFGNGGGASVLAADCFARAGLDVVPLGAATRAALSELDLPAGASIANPIDVPASILRREDGAAAARILDAVCAGGEADAVVMHLNMPVILSYRQADMLGNLIAAALKARQNHPGQVHFALVLRSDGEPEVEAEKAACRARALAAGIAVYDELPDAALALAAMQTVERHRCVGRHG